MTQGYGQQPGGQDQWGQGGQNPSGGSWGQPSPAPQQNQWGQPSPAPQPEQWGQPSPAAAPGGYPGAAQSPAGPQFGGQQYGGQQFGGPQVAGDGVNWRRVKLLGTLLLGGAALLLILRLGVGLGQIFSADATEAVNTGGTPGAVGLGSSILVLLSAIGNLVVSLAMIVIGIMAAVTGRGKARVGGIIVTAAIPVAIILYWVLVIVLVVVFAAGGSVDMDTGVMAASDYRIIYSIDLIRAILMVAVIGYGAYLVHSTARTKLAA